MRGTGRTVIAILAALALTAIPARTVRSGDLSLAPQEAHKFATQLHEIAKIVSLKYVRPISVTEVIVSGLSGLYRAAGKAPPADLADKIARAWQKDLEEIAVEELPPRDAGKKPDKPDLSRPNFPAPDPGNRGGKVEPEVRVRPQVQSGGRRRYKESELLRQIVQIRMEVGASEALAGSKAIHASLSAIAESLDPYCALVLGQGEVGLRAPTNSIGLGLELVDSSGKAPAIVKKVYLGGPAQKSGLRPGDQIVEVNKEPVRQGTLGAAAWSEKGQVAIDFRRAGETRLRHGLLKPEAVRSETVLGVNRNADNSWNYWLDPDNKIAQIRIGNIEQDTLLELNAVLLKLQAEGLAGLIFDLRWCPGGYLRVSQGIADLFVGEYNLAYFVLPTPLNWISQADPYLDNHCENATVHYRDGRLDIRARTPGAGFPFVPMVVLVNGDSSGGAELITAVLQDNHRARVMGQRTRGKASVQEVLDLLNDPSLLLSYRIDAKFKLSNALLVRPTGKNLNRFPDSRARDSWGVRPDQGLEYHVSPELSAQLKTWWSWQDLRPGNSNESLPLDNPNSDPQRQAALQVLLKAK
jgi:carboxyl-terminal processing protease